MPEMNNQEASANEYNVRSYVVTLEVASDAPNYIDCLSRINLSTMPDENNQIGVRITWPDQPESIHERVVSGDTIDLGQIGLLTYAMQFTNVRSDGKGFLAEVAIVGQRPS